MSAKAVQLGNKIIHCPLWRLIPFSGQWICDLLVSKICLYYLISITPLDTSKFIG
jgi:hypothetical protein